MEPVMAASVDLCIINQILTSDESNSVLAEGK